MTSEKKSPFRGLILHHRVIAAVARLIALMISFVPSLIVFDSAVAILLIVALVGIFMIAGSLSDVAVAIYRTGDSDD